MRCMSAQEYSGGAATSASSTFTAWFATTQIFRTQTKPNLNGGFGRIEFTNLTRGKSLKADPFKFERIY